MTFSIVTKWLVGQDETNPEASYIFKHSNKTTKSFSFVKTHDVSGFLNQEYDNREPFGYPPFKSHHQCNI